MGNICDYYYIYVIYYISLDLCMFVAVEIFPKTLTYGIIYSSLVKFVKFLLRPTDFVLKSANSKAFIYLMVRALIFW